MRASSNDLADRFAGVVRGILPDATVDVAWRKDESNGFDPLVGGGGAAQALLKKLSGEIFTRPCTLREEKDALVLVQKFIDRSRWR